MQAAFFYCFLFGVVVSKLEYDVVLFWAANVGFYQRIFLGVQFSYGYGIGGFN